MLAPRGAPTVALVVGGMAPAPPLSGDLRPPGRGRRLRPERGRALLFAVSLCRRIPPELRFPVVLSWEVPGDGEPFAPSLLRRRAGCQRHPVDLAVPDHGGDGGQHASTTATDHAELAHRPRRDSPPGGRWDGALPPTPVTAAAAPFGLSRRPARPARAISSVSRWTRVSLVLTPSAVVCRLTCAYLPGASRAVPDACGMFAPGFAPPDHEGAREASRRPDASRPRRVVALREVVGVPHPPSRRQPGPARAFAVRSTAARC